MRYGSDFGRRFLPRFGRIERLAMRTGTGAHLPHDIGNIAGAGIELGASALENRLVKFDLTGPAVQPGARDVDIIRIGGLS